MLNSIEIQNFKCITDKYIPFSDLTLFTGFNAAGKSSVLQTLLLGAQWQLQKSTDVMQLNGDLVRLGKSGEVLAENAQERVISIEYEVDEYHTKLVLDAPTDSNALVINQQNSVLDNLKRCQSMLQNLVFLSALRETKTDLYPAPNSPHASHSDVGILGQFAPWCLYEYGDSDIPSNKHCESEQNPTLRAQLNAWLGNLFPNIRCNAPAIEKVPYVRLEFSSLSHTKWKRPVNVGYGLTYAFPVIMACLLAKPDQILVIDSPEAHLHPQAQSQMGYFLGKMAASGVQIIVETHSDHILNGVRLAVAKKQISHEKVTIQFFESFDVETQNPHIISPQLDAKGQLSEWPNGFFDQTERDLAVLNGWE